MTASRYTLSTKKNNRMWFSTILLLKRFLEVIKMCHLDNQDLSLMLQNVKTGDNDIDNNNVNRNNCLIDRACIYCSM